MARASALLDRTYRFVSRYPKPYVELLDRIHQHLAPRTYVEIGVARGATLRLVLPGTVAVGIDPRPRLSGPADGDVRIFPMTSDAFFDDYDLHEVLRGLPLDLAFVDGMHQFEFALRDFINLERHSSPDTTILLHDCLPIDEASASREHDTYTWSGDVWKVVVCLKQWRPDLKVDVVDVAPTGLGVIRGCDPRSTVLSEHYTQVVEQYAEMPMSALDGRKWEMLNLVPGDWAEVRALLPDRAFRKMRIGLVKTDRVVSATLAAARRRVARLLQRGISSL
jgi:hypothetical protein